jgi:hypothetical protein
MNDLSSFKNKPMSELLHKTGAFFAFSKDQYERSVKPNVEYVSVGSGLIVEKEHAKTLVTQLAEIHDTAIKQDLAENGKDKIIERELYNHECFYTGEIDDAVDALEDYKFCREEIQAAFDKIYPTVEL